MDHRALLKKYILHVENCNFETFLYEERRYFSQFTAEEWTELQVLLMELEGEAHYGGM